MNTEITLKKIVSPTELFERLKLITFAGIYDQYGNPIKPYQHAKFARARVMPPASIGAPPKIVFAESDRNLFGEEEDINLFTSQPTIYQNQIEVLGTLDRFLKSHNINIHELEGAVEYYWEGRGDFHTLPPIIEKHSYDLDQGYINLEKLSQRFNGCYVRDAKGNLHHLADRYLQAYYIDEVSKIDHLDIFHSHAPIINYGLNRSGKFSFHVICDGSHRIDYAIETLQQPINVIVVESEQDMIPYYAFPVSFWPTMRLSSKQSEKMYVRLERDKIHLLSDLINKVLRYNWTTAGLNVSKLRSNKDIY